MNKPTPQLKKKPSDERVGIEGRWTVQVIDKDGGVKDERRGKNLITNDGLDFVKELLLDSVTPTSLSTLTHIAIGTDSTTETATDTALGAEVARAAFDNCTPGGTGVATVDYTFPASGGYEPAAIAEAGIFSDPAAGTCFNRYTFSAVNKTATDTLKLTCTITFTAV